MKRRPFIPAAVGICSLFVTLAVICIAVFSVLSLSTANAGKRLSVIYAENAYEYYSADLTANEILASIRSGDIPEGIEEESGIFSFSVPQNASEDLFVEVEVSESGYKILRWQSVRTAEWESDDKIDLFDPS